MIPFLHFGGAAIPLYGLVVTFGYAAGSWWCFKNLKHIHGTPGEFWALVYTLIFSALLGARLGYYAVEWQTLLREPAEVFFNWRSGWVFLPGFLTALLAGRVFQLVYNRLYRPRRYLQVADYFVPALALGHAIGRVACFFQGCCYGTPTSLPWAVRFTHLASNVEDRFLGVPLHPVQLLEAAGVFAIFLFLVYHVLPEIRRKRYVYGTSFFGYLGLYSLLRFLLEFLRGDDRGHFISGFLSPSQWLSLMVLVVVAYGLQRNGLIERPGKGRSIYLQ
jgi:phosphatidylglycerol:prolipoprotein diacylglycerol transferase